MILFHGSLNGVQLAYDITHGSFYTHDLPPYGYTMGHGSHLTMTKNDQKLLENMFFCNFDLNNLLFYP